MLADVVGKINTKQPHLPLIKLVPFHLLLHSIGFFVQAATAVDFDVKKLVALIE